MAEKFKVSIVQQQVEARIAQPEIRATIPGTGPQGPPGPAGGTAVTYPAGEDLSAGRVVVIDGGEAFYFQPSDETHQGRAYGITTAAATTGNNVNVQIGGEITNAAFTYAADALLYVYNNGVVVDTPPATTILQGAGVSSGGTRMRIDFSLSIKLT